MPEKNEISKNTKLSIEVRNMWFILGVAFISGTGFYQVKSDVSRATEKLNVLSGDFKEHKLNYDKTKISVIEMRESLKAIKENTADMKDMLEKMRDEK